MMAQIVLLPSIWMNQQQFGMDAARSFDSSSASLGLPTQQAKTGLVGARTSLRISPAGSDARKTAQDEPAAVWMDARIVVKKAEAQSKQICTRFLGNPTYTEYGNRGALNGYHLFANHPAGVAG